MDTDARRLRVGPGVVPGQRRPYAKTVSRSMRRSTIGFGRSSSRRRL